jgi:hypothetical protein
VSDPGCAAIGPQRRGIKTIAMSDARKKRKQDRAPNTQPNTLALKIVTVVAVVGVCAGLYFLLRHKQNSRMDAFAQCLGTKGAKMYGAYWCPHCADQKERFGSSFQYAPYVECGIKGSQAEAQVCIDAAVKHFPTWTFADGARVEGDHPLEFLGEATGCPLP